METKRTLVLADFSWILVRSDYVFSNLSTVIDGNVVQTGGMYGFVAAMRNLRRRFPYCQIVFCTDSRGSWRKEKYPWYKAKRKAKQPLLFELKDEIINMVRTMGCKVVGSNRNEADDVIATIAREVHQRPVVVYAGDKDLMQLLVQPNVVMVNDLTAERMRKIEAKDVPLEWGVNPDKLLHLRSIIGDTSDNIPPIRPRFQKKKALLLAKEFPTIEAAEQQVGEIKERYKLELTVGTLAQWRANQDVMTLRNVPLEPAQGETPDVEYFVRKYNMKSLQEIEVV